MWSQQYINWPRPFWRSQGQPPLRHHLLLQTWAAAEGSLAASRASFHRRMCRVCHLPRWRLSRSTIDCGSVAMLMPSPHLKKQATTPWMKSPTHPKVLLSASVWAKRCVACRAVPLGTWPVQKSRQKYFESAEKVAGTAAPVLPLCCVLLVIQLEM